MEPVSENIFCLKLALAGTYGRLWLTVRTLPPKGCVRGKRKPPRLVAGAERNTMNNTRETYFFSTSF